MRFLHSLKVWLPTISLSFAGFIFVTTEFIPVGLLPDIAASFGKTPSFTGLLMTIYAWIVATMSLPLTVFSGRFNRRNLSLILLVVFIIAHFIAGFALNFQMLLTSRVLVALTHSIFWSITTPLVLRVAPLGKGPQALAIMVGGTSLGNVLGIPFGTFLGHMFGWRMAFMAIGLCAFLVFSVIYRVLPSLPSSNVGSFRSVLVLAKRPIILLVYALTCITVTGHFVAFTYINPFLQNVGNFSVEYIPYILLVFGGAGVLGSVIGGRLVQKGPAKLITGALSVMLGCLLAFKFATFTMSTVILLVLVWGAALTCTIIAFQTVVLTEAADVADVANSLYSGIFNIGIGAGALIGSFVIVGHLGYIGFVGSIFVTISFSLSLLMPRKDLSKSDQKITLSH